MRSTAAATAILVFALAVTSAAAESYTYRSEYTLSALGFPIGATRIETTITPQSYRLSGSLRAKGLAALFQPTSGTLTATGRINGKGVEAKTFTIDYVTGGRKQFTEIGFAGGSVTRTVNTPEVKKHKGWIEISPAQLQNTFDPISAVLVPAASPGEVCDRTIRIFDGAMRSDIKLSFLRVIPFSTDGYRGDAITCRAKFLPVSGYPGGKKEIAWMRDKSRIDISFAPISGTGLYAPVKAIVSTQIGPVRIYATRFETVNEPSRP